MGYTSTENHITAPRLRSRCRSAQTVSNSALLNHHFGRFDDHVHGVALLQTEILGALPGDHALNHVLANLNHNSSHNLAQVDLLNGSRQLVSRGKFHSLISANQSEHSLTSYSGIVTAEAFQFAAKIRPAKGIEQILN